MPCEIKSVLKNSPAEKTGIKAGDLLISVSGNEIFDVLDYRFYQNEENLSVAVLRDGKALKFDIHKDEYEDLGLEFETYLMDKKQTCKNKCIFCFIDQMPPNMRESLYFKDDDSRLSFLFGNYITLTNISEHEIERIIKMHISPINISVHTTNPELRVKMMRNRFAGDALRTIKRFNDAGIKLNCQLVLCPGINDGKELERSLSDLTQMENVECIAAVPVGLTKYRDGLYDLKPFDKISAAKAIDIIDKFGDKCEKLYGERRVYAADEFYILSERKIPDAEYYGDFLQLENGVGMWALFKSEFNEELDFIEPKASKKHITSVTGEAAYPLIKSCADSVRKIKGFAECNVIKIVNNFFGDRITVTGLLTATDIIDQLKGKDLGEELLIPDVCLRHGTNVFLDDFTVADIERELRIKVRLVSCDGGSFARVLGGEE